MIIEYPANLNNLYHMNTDWCVYLKRPHDHTSHNTGSAQFAWIDDRPESSNHAPHSNSPSIHLNISPLRFPGDGLDFRRPVMSLPSQEVIDLTEDNSTPDYDLSRDSIFGPTPQRRTRPRLVRDIISIDDQESSGDQQNLNSPELEFMFSRTLLPTMMPQPHRRANRPLENGMDVGISIRDDENSRQRDNDVQQTSGATWAEWRSRGQRNHVMASIQEGFIRDRRRQAPAIHPQSLFMRGRGLRPPIMAVDEFVPREDPMFVNADPDLDLPGHLDFYTQGFPMGPMAQIGHMVRQPAPPTYDAPSPPRTGYTRAPKEDDILVCPNCERELGVGDTEIKKQVWVIKRCGHVSGT